MKQLIPKHLNSTGASLVPLDPDWIYEQMKKLTKDNEYSSYYPELPKDDNGDYYYPMQNDLNYGHNIFTFNKDKGELEKVGYLIVSNLLFIIIRN